MNMLFTTTNNNNLCFKSWVHIVQSHPTTKCFQIRKYVRNISNGYFRRNLAVSKLAAIHAFNKSGRHLKFSMNDVIRGKIIDVAKMATKDETLLTLILQCVYIKRNVFTLYQEEYFLYTMSLWVCHRNFKAFVRRYSWIYDIEDKRELI